MPKGQYQRKPKVIDNGPVGHVIGGEIAPRLEAAPRVEAAPALPVAGGTVAVGASASGQTLGGVGALDPVLVDGTHDPRVDLPLPAPKVETFDAWAAEEAPILPANDRVTQMVREWGGIVTVGEHNVTWVPTADASGIVVTLITPHGTSEMTASAGNWTEADIAHALDEMRTALRV